MFFADAITEITIWSILFSLLSFFINYKWGNRQKVKDIQKEVQDYQKQMAAAVKEKNDAKVKELQNKDREMMEKMQEMMLLPLKTMIIILPLFFIVITLITSTYHDFIIKLPFAIHISEILSLKIFSPSLYGPRGYFIVVSIFANLLLELIYSKTIGKDKTKTEKVLEGKITNAKPL